MVYGAIMKGVNINKFLDGSLDRLAEVSKNTETVADLFNSDTDAIRTLTINDMVWLLNKNIIDKTKESAESDN
jgi:hypothetical protein